MELEIASSLLPTEFGNFIVKVWPASKGEEPVALITPNLNVSKSVVVRVHSECMTGDTFKSLRCDCGPQKDESLKAISKSNNGMFIYLRQEGRGIGLFEKIRSYKLQEEGYDTYDANLALGHEADSREYSAAGKILKNLGVNNIELLTNNPLKVKIIQEMGFKVGKRISLIIISNTHNKKYLQTKKVKFNHLLD